MSGCCSHSSLSGYNNNNNNNTRGDPYLSTSFPLQPPPPPPPPPLHYVAANAIQRTTWGSLPPFQANQSSTLNAADTNTQTHAMLHPRPYTRVRMYTCEAQKVLVLRFHMTCCTGRVDTHSLSRTHTHSFLLVLLLSQMLREISGKSSSGDDEGKDGRMARWTKGSA